MNENLLKVIKMKYGVHKQSDVAKASGLTEATVSLIWNGKRGLTLETLSLLSKGAGVDPWDVWMESEQATPIFSQTAEELTAGLTIKGKGNE